MVIILYKVNRRLKQALANFVLLREAEVSGVDRNNPRAKYNLFYRGITIKIKFRWWLATQNREVASQEILVHLISTR